MPKEIERQFVVNTNHPDWEKLRSSLPKVYITQSTIHRGEDNKLRVRLIDDPKTWKKTAAFTFKVKQKSKKDEPNIRDEYEWEVPYRVALFIMIGHGEVTKTRYIYRHTDGKTWEFDEYTGANQWIVLADIELSSLDETFDIPLWLGQETTKMKKITNNSFTMHPYANWSEEEREWYETLKKRK
jgi:adenylate cyclase